MPRPGLRTWAFWNAPIVTTVLGTFVLAGILSLVVLVIAHDLEKERKLFEFQLETYRSFIDVSNKVVQQLLALENGRILKSEEEYDKEVARVLQTKDTLWHTRYQIDAAYKDGSIRSDAFDLHRVIWKLLHEATLNPLASEKINSLHMRYRLIAEIIEVKMMREMGLMNKGLADEVVRAFTKKLEETAPDKVED